MRKTKKPILSSKANKKGNKLVGVLFGLFFCGIGSLFCYMAGIKPLLQSIESRSWSQVECVITESFIERNIDSDGDTYRPVIRFQYTFDGRNYTGDDYQHMTSSSSSKKEEQKVVNNYPVGNETTCWVNPEDPKQAVIDNGIPSIVYFVIPFMSIFIIIGATVAFFSIRKKNPNGSQLSNRRQSKNSAPKHAIGETEIKPTTGRIAKVVVIFIFALFWNTIIGFALWDTTNGFKAPFSFSSIGFFLIPFILIGILLIVALVYQILALRNPKFEVILSEGNPELGEVIRVHWRGIGSLRRLDDLRITLQGQERATYRRGTDTRTDSCVFHKEVLFETKEPTAHSSHFLDFSIPTTSMHSFKANNNEILWQIIIEADIHRWPDINEDYKFNVRPISISQSNR